jgi:hypothetical protein
LQCFAGICRVRGLICFGISGRIETSDLRVGVRLPPGSPFNSTTFSSCAGVAFCLVPVCHLAHRSSGCLLLRLPKFCTRKLLTVSVPRRRCKRLRRACSRVARAGYGRTGRLNCPRSQPTSGCCRHEPQFSQRELATCRRCWTRMQRLRRTQCGSKTSFLDSSWRMQRLVVENNVEKGTVNLQCVASPIINEP